MLGKWIVQEKGKEERGLQGRHMEVGERYNAILRESGGEMLCWMTYGMSVCR